MELRSPGIDLTLAGDGRGLPGSEIGSRGRGRAGRSSLPGIPTLMEADSFVCRRASGMRDKDE